MRGRVVVVGAGLIGLATALRLRQRGWTVTVLDKSQPGGGASSSALGSLTPYSDHECDGATRRLAELSLENYPAWIEELRDLSGAEVDYEARGLLEVAIEPSEGTHLQESFERLAASQAPVEWLSPSAAFDLEPALNRDVCAAVLYRTEATVDVAQLIAACLRAVRKVGCTVVSNVCAYRVLAHEGIVSGVATNLGDLACDRVVLAPGVDLGTIGGVDVPLLTRIRGEVIEVRGVPGLISRHLYCGEGFMTPRRDGRIFLGSNYDLHADGDDDCATTISVRTAVRSMIATRRIVPAIDGLQIQRVWKGWRPRTADGQPLVGWLSLQGVCLAGGFYGLGITLSPAVADAVSGLLDGEDRPEVADLSPNRLPAGPTRNI